MDQILLRNEGRNSSNNSSLSLFSSSTIYKRHEARLISNEALKDDPRPISVRMLSRLPGFRSFFLPYNPSIHGRRSTRHCTSTMTPDPAFAFDSTLRDEPMLPPSNPWQPLFAATLSSGVGYCMFGPPPTTGLSPFTPRPHQLSATTFTATPGLLNVHKVVAESFSAPARILLYGHQVSLPGLAKFTSATFLRFSLRESIIHTTDSPMLGSIAAGTVTGVVGLIPAAFSRRPVLVSATPTHRIAQEVARAILYFGLLDMSSNDTMSSAVAGGLAGFLAQRTLRAIPLHALVFVGYHNLSPHAKTTRAS